MAEPIPSITLPEVDDLAQEQAWLQRSLLDWLNREYPPEAINEAIAERVAQIYFRQRVEGENDLGELVLAIATEMRHFDFSQSFYGEFTVANAVSDLLLRRLGIQPCCGQHD